MHLLSAAVISQKPRDHSINLGLHSARLNHLTLDVASVKEGQNEGWEALDRANGANWHAWPDGALAKNLLENAENPRSIPR